MLVQQLVESDEDAALTCLGVAEVLDHLVRLAGVDEDDAALDLAQLRLASASPIGIGVAMRAGLLRARHYDRSNRAVSLADCVAAESTRAMDARLASADPHLLDMCRDEGIAAIPLPDSAGRTWSP
jgi:hypothetical protein